MYNNFCKKLQSEYGADIAKWSKAYNIPQEYFAGIIAVENTSLKPTASRLEPFVYSAIVSAVNGKQNKNFPGFLSKSQYLKTLDESSLKKLASSWGLGQIMGYYTLYSDFNFTLSDLINPSKQIEIIATFANRSKKWVVTFEHLMRWWNTGSIHGKTYNSNYVKNATLAKDTYRKLIEGI